MSNVVRQMCEEMVEHQTSRGNEFRTIEPSERIGMARALVIARAQAQNSGKPLGGPEAKWEHEPFRRAMRRKKESYMYHAGRLGVDTKEARAIWTSVVYEGIDNHPARRRRLGLI